MEWIPIFLGIAVGLSVHAAWGVAQCKQIEKEIAKSLLTTQEQINHLLDLNIKTREGYYLGVDGKWYKKDWE